jgi:hypothetical protein
MLIYLGPPRPFIAGNILLGGKSASAVGPCAKNGKPKAHINFSS